ncbi:hypothetical protein B0H15DRAFT_757552, partial [Mycena belliarum]
FRENIVFGYVDEAHLIIQWGAEFCPRFRHISTFLRGHFPSSVSISVLSATIQPGTHSKLICDSLGMSGNNFYIVRSSNKHPNMQFIMEPLANGVLGMQFPQLLSYLNSSEKMVIQCPTIADIFRVFVYLWNTLSPSRNRLQCLKMYHSL